MSYQGIHCQKCGKELVPEKFFFLFFACKCVHCYCVKYLFHVYGKLSPEEGDYATVRKRTVRSFGHEPQHGEGEFPEIYVI